MTAPRRSAAHLIPPLLALCAGLGACVGPAGPVGDDGPEATGSTGMPETTTTSTSETAAPDDTTDPGTTHLPTDDTTGPFVGCGNGMVEPGEQCDGEDLGGSTCLNLFGYGGELACTEQCTFDLLQCFPPGMILVPGGEFWMGSNGHGLDELPARKVHVDDFFIDATEVTVSRYASCVQDGACELPDIGGQCTWGAPGREDHPINCVSWYGADDYCRWTGGVAPKRLPTEAEWEKAARSDDERLYPWGNEPPPDCTLVTMNLGGGGGCGMLGTLPVGSKPLGASPYGVQDMAGSVWNWVADWYGPYDVAENDDPTGPPTGLYRVIRGGGWNTTDINWFRTSARNFAQHEGNANIGFRCAVAVPSVE